MGSTLFLLLPGYIAVQDGTIKTDGKIVGRILGGAFAQGGNKLRNLQVIRVGNGNAYVATATALKSTWESYKDIFEESLEQTFEIVEKK